MNCFNSLSEEHIRGKRFLEKALFFYIHKFYVYPINTEQDPPKWSKTWNKYTQNEEDIKRYNWQRATGIYAVVGKKGIRAVKINVENLKDKHFLIDAALYLLHLPSDYCWVLDNSIFIASPDDRMGDWNSYSNGIEFIWQGYAPLSLPNTYYFCPQKIKRPQHVNNELLFECVRSLRLAQKQPWRDNMERLIKERKETEYNKPREVKPRTSNNTKCVSKINLIWHEIIEGLRCLGQIIFLTISIIIILLVGGYLTKGCESHVNTDHIHYERFH